ncbi:MAG: peptide chain release factor 2 [Culicoidibacterales bacterium]
MREFSLLLSKLRNELDSLEISLDIKNKNILIQQNDEKMSQINFWQNKEEAQLVVSAQSKLKRVLDRYYDLSEKLAETATYFEMIQEEFSNVEYNHLTKELIKWKQEIEDFSQLMLFNGVHDDENAYLEIHPGEGGVDAQDFAQILYRMYGRWAEKNGFTAELLEYNAGDEAGLKSVVMLLKGSYAYGRLRSEHGVHRLIRLSPFDTAKRRHTSFASVSILPEISTEIAINIPDGELRIDTFRSSGAGGQSVNTTDSAVRITHLPTGMVACCQNQRSQIQNREYALKMLYAKLQHRAEQEQTAKISVIKGEKRGIGFGSQIRSYVFHPYSLVKDHRTNHEVGNTSEVIDGGIGGFIESYLKSGYNRPKKSENENEI